MDIFERFNNKFGKWYEGLFGGEASELRPKDVLRKIIAAMEDNRKEGFDAKIYVPNKYVLELAVDDPEERDYLLSFLDEEELVSVLQKFMAQNHYHARGPLDFTIAEVPEGERDSRREKLRVKVRFAKGDIAAAPAQTQPAKAAPDLAQGDDLPTVAGRDWDDEPGTVPAIAWASLAVTAPDGRKSHLSLTKPSVKIGRSRNAGNDLVLDSDGLASKAHARLERESDGAWTVYDLGSTNGVKVNGQRIDGNRTLADEDALTIGGTTLVFQVGGREETAAPSPVEPRRARLILANGEAHVLASETLIGRAVTSDIVLADPSVSMKHARIISPDPTTYSLEDLESGAGTWLNGERLLAARRAPLAAGDLINFGTTKVRFQLGDRP